jgi:hypothetical protein
MSLVSVIPSVNYEEKVQTKLDVVSNSCADVQAYCLELRSKSNILE